MEIISFLKLISPWRFSSASLVTVAAASLVTVAAALLPSWHSGRLLQRGWAHPSTDNPAQNFLWYSTVKIDQILSYLIRWNVLDALKCIYLVNIFRKELEFEPLVSVMSQWLCWTSKHEKMNWREKYDCLIVSSQHLVACVFVILDSKNFTRWLVGARKQIPLSAKKIKAVKVKYQHHFCVLNAQTLLRYQQNIIYGSCSIPKCWGKKAKTIAKMTPYELSIIETVCVIWNVRLESWNGKVVLTLRFSVRHCASNQCEQCEQQDYGLHVCWWCGWSTWKKLVLSKMWKFN